MNAKTWIWALVIASLLVGGGADAKIRVVTSTSDIASIVKMIGGDKVKVESIVSGRSDPHFVEVLPSYMVKIARADVYFKIGMDLDYWANQLIDGSGNGNLIIVDCSEGIDPLERPTTKVDASMGDVHVQGNPHYWLDPDNGLVIAEAVTAALIQADPENVSLYEANLESFRQKLDAKRQEWADLARSLKGIEIITYHNSWPYLCKTLGIHVVGFVEPKPGIEPTPSHTARLITMIKSKQIKVIGKEPYFSDRTPKSIARQTGAAVVDLPPSVGGVKEATDYFALFDTLIGILTSSLKD
jgi:ABC-type Zn uptake system ZnuABC Zn-binding protein ZnuA